MLVSIKSLLLVAFGASWRTTILGYSAAALVEASAYFSGQGAPGWHAVAFGLAALGRVAQDAASKAQAAAPSGQTKSA